MFSATPNCVSRSALPLPPPVPARLERPGTLPPPWLVAGLLACVLGAGLLGACPRRLPPPPPGLLEARTTYQTARGDVDALVLALERYQTVASAAPEGPYAPEAAYALGLIAIDLHLFSLPPFAPIPGLQQNLAAKLAQRGIPASVLLRFAVRVFTVARDGWKEQERERAERAIELSGNLERLESLLAELAEKPADSPLRRYATLEALGENMEKFLRLAEHRELVERAVLYQRTVQLALLAFIDERPGCAVLAFLAKHFLGKNLDPDTPLAECFTSLGGGATVVKARLTRAAWVKLEEFALDRPDSPLGPIAQRLLGAAPPEARRPPPR